MKKKIGILTGGGDCPGLNPAIRGCVYAAERYGYERYDGGPRERHAHFAERLQRQSLYFVWKAGGPKPGR